MLLERLPHADHRATPLDQHSAHLPSGGASIAEEPQPLLAHNGIETPVRHIQPRGITLPPIDARRLRGQRKLAADSEQVLVDVHGHDLPRAPYPCGRLPGDAASTRCNVQHTLPASQRCMPQHEQFLRPRVSDRRPEIFVVYLSWRPLASIDHCGSPITRT
jgi:hypothetical protein